eukprot:jgi/Orpsp1_1/1177175/evm.model.c7180000060462.1
MLRELTPLWKNSTYDMAIFDDRLLLSDIELMRTYACGTYLHSFLPTDDYIFDMTDYVKNDELKHHDNEILSHTYDEKHIYALPYEKDFDLIYYNELDENFKNIAKSMSTLTWNELYNMTYSEPEKHTMIALGDDDNLLNFFFEYMNSQFDISKTPDNKYFDQFCEEEFVEKFYSFRDFVFDYTRNNYNRTLHLSLDDAFTYFVNDASPFYKGKASHYHLFDEIENENENENENGNGNDEKTYSKFSSVLPPKYQSAIIEHFVVINKNSIIDKDILMEIAKILTSKEMQLFKAERFGSIPTFDFSKKDTDSDIKKYCEMHSKICEHSEKIKKIHLKDLFDSKYTPAFFETRLLLPSVIKRFIRFDSIDLLTFTLNNIKELVTDHMGIYSFLTYFLMSVFVISTLIIMVLTFYHRKHPYLKAISPNFCIIILFGYILSTISILMYLPPFSVLKSKIFYIMETICYTIILAPMFAVTFRIYRIFKSDSLISKSLDDLHLIMYVSIFTGIVFIYKLIIVSCEKFYFLAYGYINASYRLARYTFTNFKVYDTIDM